MSNSPIAKQEESYLSEAKFEHAYRMAKMISTTQLIPKAYHNKPADVLVAFEFGRSLGLGYLQAVQNIAVINGKPAIWGDAMLAVCQGHPDFEYIKETPITTGAGELDGYECEIKRQGYPEPTIRRFTVADAKKANLWGKNVWASYPARMLQMRARAFALRDTFADALSGVSMVEEVQDIKPVKDITPKQEKNQAAKDELLGLLNKDTGEVYESEPESEEPDTDSEAAAEREAIQAEAV